MRNSILRHQTLYELFHPMAGAEQQLTRC